jgi:hypothetical protein
MTRRRIIVRNAFDCGDGKHRVITLLTDKPKAAMVHRVTPCEQCPWRRDVPTGEFPVSAYKHSATTSYDLAETTFSCHMAGRDKPATCAGFLLRGADHNLAVRLALFARRYNPLRVHDSGLPLFESYRAMAIANGVSADDPTLAACRGIDEPIRRGTARKKRERIA